MIKCGAEHGLKIIRPRDPGVRRRRRSDDAGLARDYASSTMRLAEVRTRSTTGPLLDFELRKYANSPVKH